MIITYALFVPALMVGIDCEAPMTTLNGSVHDTARCWSQSYSDMEDSSAEILSRIEVLERNVSILNVANNASEKPMNAIQGSLSPDSILVASATIMAFTTFGSLMGIRIVKDPGMVKSQGRGLALTYASAAAIIASQMTVINSLWDGTPELIYPAFYLTGLFMLLVILGSIVLASGQIKSAQRRDTWTS